MYIQIININENNYPIQLKMLKNPPQKLYAEGDINLLYKNSVAVVGARLCTEYGERNARKFTKKLASLNITTVSGMAIGIDSITHRTSMENSAKTIAVLPSGLNNIYPKENIMLFNNILNSGGLVISEYSPNTCYSRKKCN